jgi:hypothetical protein
MTKKILLSLFILLMVAVSIIAYNFYKNIKEPVNKTALEAIPQNAAIIIKENNFNAIYNKIASTNIIWEELVANTITASKVKSQIHYIDSLITGPFAPLFKNTPILSSIHLSGANDFDFIFYLPIIADVSEADLINKIKNVTRRNTTNREYDGANIHTIPTSNTDKISLIIYKNTLVFSYSTVLIEDVIRQLNSDNNLLTDSTFSKVISTSGQSDDGNLFVNNKYFSKIVNQYVNKSTKKYIASFENYVGWTEFDVNIKPNSLALSGFSFTTEVSDYSIHLFKGQKPQEIDILSIIPYNTSFIYHYGLSNSKSYFENRVKLLKSTHQYFNYQKYLDEHTANFGIDLEEVFLSSIGNEIAFVITESLTDDFAANQFIIFQSNEIDKTKEKLLELSKKVNTELVEPLTFNEYVINKINLPNLFPNLLGKPFINLENNYYTTINDYVVFGNSKNALETFITNFINHKVLGENSNFQEFNNNISSSSNIFIYNNIARSTNLYKAYSKNDYLPVIDEKLELFRKFEAVTFQVTAEKNNLFYNNIFLKYNPIYKQETSSLWELELDSTISSTPQLVINHNTNSKEIIVQDDANKIYLISNTGKVIWTKQLNEKVISKFHQIDIYKNNKLQLLFNTKSKIYLIDRNGNNVEKFPIKLPSDASNGITVLDYNQNKNYRLLIGCNDNMVYNYSAEGTNVEGWEYSPTESPANGKIWHFAQAGKDYIIIPLKNGKIKVIQRNGADRIKIKNQIPFTRNLLNLKIGTDLSKTYLITSDTLGNVVKLFLNDKKEVITFENIPKNALFNFFDYNNDNSNDYVFMWDNMVKIIDSDKKEIYHSEFPSTITQIPLKFNMPDKTNKIGLVIDNQIYLINNLGEIEDNFPLAGNTEFKIADINNDKTTNLVVANKRMIYTYVLK